jgi:hypothetical protein
MPRLNVSYANGQLSIVGGDDNGANVTILYGQNANITWNRVGNNFKFKDFKVTPGGGPFSNQTVTDDTISIDDDDDNNSGQDKAYEYTITIKDSSGALKRFDPQVINKSGSGPMLLALLKKAKGKGGKAVKAPRKGATRTTRKYR